MVVSHDGADGDPASLRGFGTCLDGCVHSLTATLSTSTRDWSVRKLYGSDYGGIGWSTIRALIIPEDLGEKMIHQPHLDHRLGQ